MSAQTPLAVMMGSSSPRELAAVVGRGVGGGPGPDQTMGAVDADLVLVAEYWDGDFDPAPLCDRR